MGTPDQVTRVTLDTNVVIDLWRDDEQWRTEVEELIELARVGEIDLAVTRSLRTEVLGSHADRLVELLRVDVLEVGGVSTLSESALNGWDHLGDQAIMDLEIELRTVAAASGGAKPPEHMDWLLLHEHKVQARDVFLTRDDPILRIAGELVDVGVVVMTPRDFLRDLGTA